MSDKSPFLQIFFDHLKAFLLRIPDFPGMRAIMLFYSGRKALRILSVLFRKHIEALLEGFAKVSVV